MSYDIIKEFFSPAGFILLFLYVKSRLDRIDVNIQKIWDKIFLLMER